jgi:Fe-S-cluster-containing hydrogenase component 2
MPRARMIRPDFWSDEKIGSLSHIGRLLFIGMWNFSDDEGIIKSNELYLKGSIFPYDNIDLFEIEKALKCIEESGLIFSYIVNSQKYSWIIKFRIHQRIDKPQISINPYPNIQNKDYHTAINKRDSYICHICGKICEPFGKINIVKSTVASIDHLIPISKGGKDYPSNLKTACISCNKSRGNKPIKFQERSKNVIGTLFDNSMPNINEDKLSEDKLSESENNTDDDLFNEFWNQYPRHEKKKNTIEAFKKINFKNITFEKIMESLLKQKMSEQWIKDDGKFIPHPTTWINGKRWEDELSQNDGLNETQRSILACEKRDIENGK